MEKQVEAWNGVIDRYLRPLEILAASPAQLMSLGATAHECRRDALAATYSLRNIASAGIAGLTTLVAFQLRRDELQLPPPVGEWLDSLVTEVAQAEQNATQQLAQIDEIISRSGELEARDEAATFSTTNNGAFSRSAIRWANGSSITRFTICSRAKRA